MKRLAYILCVFFIALPAYGATVTASVTLPRGTVLSETDIIVETADDKTRADILTKYVGKELKRTVYEGYRLNPAYVGKPVLVKRNSRVSMIYRMGSMEITAWGRALEEGGAGDVINIMNLQSRKKVMGQITEAGTIKVSP